MRLAIIAAILAAALVGCFFVSVSVPVAWGHSFYEAYCCSGQDCEPIDGRRVELVPGGYLLDATHFIAEKEARQAPDGNYHACFWPNPETLRCFYKPALGS